MMPPTHNPEFQRQLWLNWRPSLALWTLLLTGLILGLPLALSSPRERLPNLGLTALTGLWIATTLYASVLAARSLREEIQQHTWDWQRLSALTPWQMAWGKLLGATVPAWLYAALFGVTSIVVASLWEMLWDTHRAWHLLALAVLWGLGVQTWAMNAVLVRWHSGLWQRRSLGLLLVIGLPFLLGLLRGLPERAAWPWWGWDLGPLGLAYVLGCTTLGLGLLALWRQLCERLDVPTLPWAWPLGLTVAGVAGAGVWHHDVAALWPHLAAWALLGTAFIALQHMGSQARAWRQVLWCGQQGRWSAALAALPLWPVSWLLAVLAAVLAWGHANTSALGWWLLLACAQLLREGLILTGFALQAQRWKSPGAVFAVTWLVINLLLPLLAWGAMGSTTATALQPLVVLMGEVAPVDALPRSLAWLALGAQLLLAVLWVRWAARQPVPRAGGGVSAAPVAENPAAP